MKQQKGEAQFQLAFGQYRCMGFENYIYTQSGEIYDNLSSIIQIKQNLHKSKTKITAEDLVLSNIEPKGHVWYLMVTCMLPSQA